MGTHATTVPAVGFLCLLLATPPGVSPVQAAPETRLLKVFLSDFEDIPHPDSYSREYFDQLLFGLDGPRQTPEGRPLSGSVREYFRDLSEGRVDVEGEVVDWARLPGRITQIPHWKPGITPFGESWPVIVAETLRANGIVGPDARDKVRLADGRMPDLLVFLNTDWGVGGVNRGWGNLKEVLGIMKLGDLWDEAWAGLPSPFSSYSATIWPHAPGTGPDGGLGQVPAAADLELFPLSIMMHEMGHQLAGWPDLYGPAFEPWGVFDLMGGPAACTHFPMGASAYLRVGSGWMQFTDMSLATHQGLLLEPLDTHREALRFPQGPGQESLVAENRWCLKYPGSYSQPPTNEGPRVLLYRLDEGGRRRMVYGESAVAKITTVIRRPESYGELWGGEGFGEVTAGTVPSSRNSLGELWWEFGNIRPGPPSAMALDADLRATDLVREFCRATWTDDQGAPVEAGRYGDRRGYVCVVPPLGSDGRTAPGLRLVTGPGGALRGRYPLAPGTPRRLYATVALAAPSPGPVTLTVAPNSGDATELLLRGDATSAARTVIVELPAEADAVDLILQAAEGAAAEVDLTGAWLVGLPEVVAELAHAAPSWSPPDPPLPGATALLCDGCTYGPAPPRVPVGGEGPATRTARWPVTLPGGNLMLRGLFGLTGDAPAGSTVTVALSITAGERTWPLVRNLEVSAPAAPGTGEGWPAVVEVNLPAETQGQACTVALDVATSAEHGITVAVPSLFLCPR